MNNLIVFLFILWFVAIIYAIFGHRVIRKDGKQSKLDYDDPQVKLWLEIIFSSPPKKVYPGKSYTK